MNPACPWGGREAGLCAVAGSLGLRIRRRESRDGRRQAVAHYLKLVARRHRLGWGYNKWFAENLGKVPHRLSPVSRIDFSLLILDEFGQLAELARLEGCADVCELFAR